MQARDNRPPVLALPPEAKRRKYGNTPVTIEGMHFDSQAEAGRFFQLREKETRGEIKFLRRQPVYELEPSAIVNGHKLRAINYVGDFAYDEGGASIVEDVKGGRATRTRVFELKRNLFLRRYPGLVLRITG